MLLYATSGSAAARLSGTEVRDGGYLIDTAMHSCPRAITLQER